MLFQNPGISTWTFQNPESPDPVATRFDDTFFPRPIFGFLNSGISDFGIFELAHFLFSEFASAWIVGFLFLFKFTQFRNFRILHFRISECLILLIFRFLFFSIWENVNFRFSAFWNFYISGFLNLGISEIGDFCRSAFLSWWVSGFWFSRPVHFQKFEVSECANFQISEFVEFPNFPNFQISRISESQNAICK